MKLAPKSVKLATIVGMVNALIVEPTGIVVGAYNKSLHLTPKSGAGEFYVRHRE